MIPKKHKNRYSSKRPSNKYLLEKVFSIIFVVRFGALAERLGTGLQNLGQRFDSARHLKIKDMAFRHVFYF